MTRWQQKKIFSYGIWRTLNWCQNSFVKWQVLPCWPSGFPPLSRPLNPSAVRSDWWLPDGGATQPSQASSCPLSQGLCRPCPCLTLCSPACGLPCACCTWSPTPPVGMSGVAFLSPPGAEAGLHFPLLFEFMVMWLALTNIRWREVRCFTSRGSGSRQCCFPVPSPAVLVPAVPHLSSGVPQWEEGRGESPDFSGRADWVKNNSLLF
jgi:hypothetical protein